MHTTAPRRRLCQSLGLLVACLATAASAQAGGLVISAQDGKFQRIDGQATTRHPPVPDSVVVIDTAASPPRLIARITRGIAQSVAGPPQSAAISPDGRLALLGAADHLDATGAVIDDPVLQVVSLSGPDPGVIARLPMGAVIQGLAFDPSGTLALACGVDGQLRVLRIAGDGVRLTRTLRLAPGRLASVAIAPDGRLALVTRRDDGGVAVLELRDGDVRPTGVILGSGLQPYAVDISADGRWAVAGNVGVAGLPGLRPGQDSGGADTITLYDLKASPPHARDHAAVAAAPEGVAISPDGHWIAVQSMDGSFLPPGHPAHTATGVLTLFANRSGRLVRTDRMAGGIAGQGLVFGEDGRTLFVQRNVEREIAVYRRIGGRLAATGTVFHLDAGPVAIRRQP